MISRILRKIFGIIVKLHYLCCREKETTPDLKVTKQKHTIIMKKVVTLKAICDTWNMINEYNIQNWKQVDSMTVEIPSSEFDRVLSEVKNKRYWMDLLK